MYANEYVAIIVQSVRQRNGFVNKRETKNNVAIIAIWQKEKISIAQS